MDECIEKEGVLNIVTENNMGGDILLHITIIKPRRDMTYHELGLLVWNWPYLCVHQINEGSIFEHTPIREMDQIRAINDIDCSKMRGVGGGVDDDYVGEEEASVYWFVQVRL